MSEDQHTKYTVYAARAAEDLPITGTELKVIVPELTPAALSGAFAPGTSQSSVQLKDISGGSVSASPTTANHIVAVWSGTSNLAYPPFVKAGEQVEVVQYGDSDRYYWREMGRDRELRQLDHYRIEVSATKSKNTAKADNNTYFLELDAVNGVVQIKTSKANGEPFAYGFKIDTKNGTVLLSDDATPTPNRIYLDSGKTSGVPKLQLNNSKNSLISLVGEDIAIVAPRDILIRAGRQIVEEAPIATLNWKIGLINGNSLGISSSDSTVVSTPTFDIIGNSKTTGLAVAGTMRARYYFNGDIGTKPNMPTTTPPAGTATPGNNTPDTGLPLTYRHAVAWEQLTPMMSTITTWFEQVQARIGVPTTDDTLNTLAVTSRMIYNTGE